MEEKHTRHDQWTLLSLVVLNEFVKTFFICDLLIILIG